MGLALLTSQHARHFESERALWTQAVRVAPEAPRPWIGLAWVALDAGELAAASVDLDRAWARTDHLTPTERDWARDAIDATRALILLRRGQLIEAGRLMAQGPPLSERAALCEHFARICALGTP